MHHVRSISDVNKAKNPVEQHMMTIGRRQVPLCYKHHLEIHKGDWRNVTNKIPKSSQKKPSIEKKDRSDGKSKKLNVVVGEPSDG